MSIAKRKVNEKAWALAECQQGSASPPMNQLSRVVRALTPRGAIARGMSAERQRSAFAKISQPSEMVNELVGQSKQFYPAAGAIESFDDDGDRTTIAGARMHGGEVAWAVPTSVSMPQRGLSSNAEEHELPNPTMNPTANPITDSFRVLGFVRRKAPLAIGVLCSTIDGAGLPIWCVLFAEVINEMLTKGNRESVIEGYCYVFFSVGAIVGLAQFGSAACFGSVGEQITYSVRESTFAKILAQDMAWFDQPGNSRGELNSILSRDTMSLRGAVGDRFRPYITSGVGILTGLAIAFASCWRVALLALAPFPLLIGAGMAQNKATSLTTVSDNDAGQIASSSVENIRDVLTGAGPRLTLDRYQRAVARLAPKQRRCALVVAATVGLGEFVVLATAAAIFYGGGWLVNKGYCDFVEFQRAFNCTTIPVMFAGQLLAELPDPAALKLALQRVHRIWQLAPLATDTDGLGKATRIEGKIEFRNVSFSYPGRAQKVLDAVSFVVEPNTTVALVGCSGSGKSTIFQLLLQFYQPQEGTILVDDKPLGTYDKTELREHMSFVTQEPQLFSTTIGANIWYGMPEDTPVAVLNAASKRASAYDFITQTTLGYDTPVGEGGSGLSGGQRQRVAIARTFAKPQDNLAILLLDEATSALDNESEKAVQLELDGLSRDRTALVIAHRLSTIRDADNILVFDQGKIIEQGTHDQLVATGGAYHQLLKIQEEGLRLAEGLKE
jgi:ABC-type multidrug transport system fused ATPase/permease subunit